MKEDLIEKGKKIVEELGGERQDVLSKWMAHYVAELMERAKLKNKKEAELASEKCSQLILKLWEKKIKEQLLELKHRMRGGQLPLSDQNDKVYQEIKDIIDNPKRVKKVLDFEMGGILLFLSDIEGLLIKLLWISEVLNPVGTAELDEVTQMIVNSEEETQSIRQRLAKIFPPFSNISLTDQEATQKHVKEALCSIDKVRQKIIWGR